MAKTTLTLPKAFHREKLPPHLLEPKEPPPRERKPFSLLPKVHPIPAGFELVKPTDAQPTVTSLPARTSTIRQPSRQPPRQPSLFPIPEGFEVVGDVSHETRPKPELRPEFQKILDEGKAKFARGDPLTGRDQVANFVSRVAQGLGQVAAAIPKSAGIIQGAVTGTPAEQTGLFKAGKAIEEGVESLAPGFERARGTFAGDVLPRAIGTGLGFIGAGVAGKAISGASKLIPFVTAATAGATLESSALYEEAKAHGASESVALWSAAAGIPIGATEALPISRLLNRFDKATGGQFSSAFKRVLKETAKGAVEETVQEGIQSTLSNAVAKAFDKDRGLFDDITESMAAGGIVGGLFNFVGIALGARRSRLRRDPLQAPAGEVELIREPPRDTVRPPAKGAIQVGPEQAANIPVRGETIRTPDNFLDAPSGPVRPAVSEPLPKAKEPKVEKPTDQGRELPTVPARQALPAPKQESTGGTVRPDQRVQETGRPAQEPVQPSELKPAKPEAKKLPEKIASDEQKLAALRAKKFKTAGDEKSIKLTEARIKADPSKWNPGDGVGYRVANQINRGFRVVRVDAAKKLALIRQVADTGLTTTGGDTDRISDQWVHVAELVRDRKYNAPKPLPPKPAEAKKSLGKDLTSQERTALIFEVGLEIGTGKTTQATELSVMKILGADTIGEIAPKLKSASDAVVREVHRVVQGAKKVSQAKATKEGKASTDALPSKTPRLDAIEEQAKKEFREAARELGGGTVFSGPLPPVTVKLIVSASKIAAVRVVRGGMKVGAAVREALKALGVKRERVSDKTFKEIVKQSARIVRRSKKHPENLDSVVERFAIDFAVEHLQTTEPLPKDATAAEALSFIQKLKARLNEMVRFPDLATESVFDAEEPVSKETLAKINKLLSEAKPIRLAAEILSERERSKRAAKLRTVFEKKRGREAVIAAAGAAKGEFPIPVFEPIGPKLTSAEVEAAVNHIITHRLEMSPQERFGLTFTFLKVVDHGVLPHQGELAQFERIFGPGFVRALIGKIPLSKRALDLVGELLGTFRPAITAYDISATGRQAWELLTAHPIMAARAYKAQLRAFASQEYADVVAKELSTGPRAKVRDRVGLERTSFGDKPVTLAKKEEEFRSNFFNLMARAELRGAGKALVPLKLHAKVIVASERAFATFLNKLRADVFDAYAADLRARGISPNTREGIKAYKELAKVINAATGRGSIEFKGKWWSRIFFAPRFVTSRFESIYRTKNILTGPPVVRRLVLRKTLTTVGAWLGLAALIKMAADAYDWDLEFELDPRSSDFLKARFGDTRIDFGAGYGQVIRLVAQTILRQRKDLNTGKVRKIQQFGPLTQFARFKLAPVPGALASIHKGKTPDQKPATPLNILKGLTVPIVFQNLNEVIQEHGAAGLAILPFELHGAGVAVHEFNPEEFADFEKGDSRTPIYNRLWLMVRRGDKAGMVEATRTLKKTGATYGQIRTSFNNRKIEGTIPPEIGRAFSLPLKKAG